MKSKKKNSFIEAYKSVRKFWGMKPVTSVKGNTKAEISKNACRTGKKSGNVEQFKKDE